MTPDVLALLGDDVPRAKAAIVAALADRHPKDDIKRAIARLAVTEQLVERQQVHPAGAGLRRLP